MCSAITNATADDCLDDLGRGKDRRMIENRLADMAGEANVTTPGGLDFIPPMTRMPPSLSGVRKMTVGRHRVYYTGHHTQCRFRVFYVKINKKKGVDDDDDKSFQNRLERALAAKGERTLIGGQR